MQDFRDVVDLLLELINGAIPIVFALALLVFMWKLVDAWIINGGDPGSIEAGKQTLVVGIVVFVVMTSLWGIVALLRTSLF